MVFLTIAAAYLVNLQRRHAGTNVLCHLVEHAGIDNACTTDAFNLFRGLNQVAGGYQLAFRFPVHHLLIQFRWLLPGKTVPSSFLCHCFLNLGAKVLNNAQSTMHN